MGDLMGNDAGDGASLPSALRCCSSFRWGHFGPRSPACMPKCMCMSSRLCLSGTVEFGVHMQHAQNDGGPHVQHDSDPPSLLRDALEMLSAFSRRDAACGPSCWCVYKLV